MRAMLAVRALHRYCNHMSDTTEHSDEDTLRPGEAAQLLRISTTTLFRWGNLGRINYTRAHRWSTERRYTRTEINRVLQLKADTPTDQETTP